jgi:selenophosphate synthase
MLITIIVLLTFDISLYIDGREPDVLRACTPHDRLAWATAAMPCRGCGSKVRPLVLLDVLRTLPTTGYPGVAASPDRDATFAALDDAAVVASPPDGQVSVQTADFLAACVDDPYIFGRIAAIHALSDCFAMGAEPKVALAIAQVRSKPLDAVFYRTARHSTHSPVHSLCVCQCPNHVTGSVAVAACRYHMGHQPL